MPFDMTPKPILNSTIFELPPLERLERLGDWLYAGGPGEQGWDYTQILSPCKTIGCALGWFRELTGASSEVYFNASDLGITKSEAATIFVSVGDPRKVSEVTPQDVAKTIYSVLKKRGYNHD